MIEVGESGVILVQNMVGHDAFRWQMSEGSSWGVESPGPSVQGVQGPVSSIHPEIQSIGGMYKNKKFILAVYSIYKKRGGVNIYSTYYNINKNREQTKNKTFISTKRIQIFCLEV